MGELSKRVGEKGEEILKFLFEDILNFNNLLQNKTIDCIKGEKHKRNGTKNERKTHGIDGIVSYKSPLEDFCLDIGIISSKYTSKEYPKNPISDFKSYFQDLAETIECFNNSKIKNQINQNFDNVNKAEIIGILLWLSHQDNANYDLISKVDNCIIDDEFIFDKIIIIDNGRANFLYQSIWKTKQIFKNENVDFVYHNSGLNSISQSRESYGKTFPLHYLYSDIIPLRVLNQDKVEFHLYINDNFQKEQFTQILGFAQSFDLLNSTKLIINYLDYDDLNRNEIKEKLFHYPNYKLGENLEVREFPLDIKNDSI